MFTVSAWGWRWEQELAANGQKGTSGDGNLLKLGCGDGFTTL